MAVIPCRQLQNRIHDSDGWKNVLFSGQSVRSDSPKPEGMSCRIGFPFSTKGILRAEVRGPIEQNQG
jgi:hypothetical protein